MSALVIIGGFIAASIHVVIFVMESLAWGRPWVNRAFRLQPEQADANRLFAFNQGVYNLALALVTFAGLCARATSEPIVGAAVLCCGCFPMILAALALFVSARHLWRSALIQGIPPAVAVLGLLF